MKNWRKLLYLLPNSFTCSSIFCGFYAMTLCLGNPGPTQFYDAAICIVYAFFFDGIDGRVARLTKTQSDFGVELDSLADVVSFGVAPALLVYRWALAPLGFPGLFLSFAFAACGALRLARFNVMAQRKIAGSSKFFTGLPIPLAAGTLISLIISTHAAGFEESPAARLMVAALVAVLAFLMVSTVRYRTFKDLRLSRRSAMAFLTLALAGVGVALQGRPAFVLSAYFTAYIFLGLAESVVFFKRNRAERLAARASSPAAAAVALAVEDADDLEDDEEEDDELP